MAAVAREPRHTHSHTAHTHTHTWVGRGRFTPHTYTSTRAVPGTDTWGGTRVSRGQRRRGSGRLRERTVPRGSGAAGALGGFSSGGNGDPVIPMPAFCADGNMLMQMPPNIPSACLYTCVYLIREHLAFVCVRVTPPRACSNTLIISAARPPLQCICCSLGCM